MYDPRENVDRHNPNYPANDSVWKAQNKCIPARKVKKDKLQMNQNSNSQGNLVVLLIPYFFFHKNSNSNSTFTQEDIQAVWSHHPWILCTVQSQQHPPSPHPPARTVSLHWFATRTPKVFLHPNAKRPFTDSSPFFK